MAHWTRTLISRLLTLFLLSSLLLNSDYAQALEETIEFGGFDIYGSQRLTEDIVRADHGSQLDECIKLKLQDLSDEFAACRDVFDSAIKEHFDLAYAHLAGITYFHLSPPKAYLTLDVVEKADASRRLDFLSAPTGQFTDVDEVLDAWDRYMTIAWELVKQGELSGMRVACKAFHCIFGHEHPRLAPFEGIFVNGARDKRSELEQVFLNDRRSERRAQAAFVLAYVTDGRWLVDTLAKRLRDPSFDVRNNVTRVFSDIADHYSDLELPLSDIITLFNFPDTTDRNKAAATVFFVVKNPVTREKYRGLILRDAVPHLLKMLRLLQLNNHDFAYFILRELSGESYGAREYDRWEGWYRDQLPIR